MATTSISTSRHGDDQLRRHRQRPGRQLDRHPADGARAAAAHGAADQGHDHPEHGLRVRQDQERRLDPATTSPSSWPTRRPGRRRSRPRRASRSRRRPTARRPAPTRSRSARSRACRRSPAWRSPPTAAVGAGTLHIELGTWGGGVNGAPPTFAAFGHAAGRRHRRLGDRHDGRRARQDQRRQRRRDRDDHDGRERLAAADPLQRDRRGQRLSHLGRPMPTATTPMPRGLSALAYDPSTGASQMTRSQTAADAVATVNGLAVTLGEQHADQHRRRPDPEPQRDRRRRRRRSTSSPTPTRSRRRSPTSRRPTRRSTSSSPPTPSTTPTSQAGRHPAGRQRRSRPAEPAARPRRRPVGRLDARSRACPTPACRSRRTAR